jgi:hypothetical protein
MALGVPRKSVLRYETELRADKYLVIAHGDAKDIELAREIMNRHEAIGTESVAA